MKRRWLCLFMTLCFLFAFDPPALAAETNTGEELIVNGGFENVDGAGKPEGAHDATTETNGWITGSTYWGTKTFVDDTEKKSGTYSAKVVDDNGSQPSVSYWVYNVVPGAEYQLSTWMLVESDDADAKKGAGYKVEFRTAENEASAEGTVSDELVLDTGGAWVKKEWSFYAPYDTVKMKVYLRMHTNGTVWFDDVSLKRTGNLLPPFRIMTDSVFYYTDRTDDCRAQITMIDRMMEIEGISFAEDAKATFSFLDSAGNAKRTADVAVIDGTAMFTFPPSLLEKEKDCTILVSMTDTNGKTYTAKQIISLYDRPTALGVDGTYYKVSMEEQADDTYSYTRTEEAFHPVIGYHVGDITEDNLEKVKKLGINVVQLSNTSSASTLKERLDIVQKAEMMAIVSLYNKIENAMQPAAHPGNVANTQKLISQVTYKHPAVFAYALIDEPSSNLVMTERDKLLRDSYSLVRSLDPHRPTYLCDFLSLADIQRYADVFCMDRYQVYDYGKNVSIVRQASLGKRPVYTLMRCHKVDDTTLVNMNMLRYMFYDGLMEGAKGVGFYPYYDGKGNDIVANEDLHTAIIAMKDSGEQGAAFAHFLEGEAPSGGITANGIKWSLSADKKHLVLLNTNTTSKAISVPEVLGEEWSYFTLSAPYGENPAAVEYWHDDRVTLSAQSAHVFSVEVLAGGFAPVFLGEDGTVISNLPASGAVTLKCKKLNETGSLYAAYYRKNGSAYELIGLFEAAETGEDMLSCVVALPADRTDCKLSAFYWDNEALCPMMGVRQLN